jgi:hypothetical protein
MVGSLKFAREVRAPKGGYEYLKNSTGKRRGVKPNATVYHRGNGRYAQYSEARDRARKAHTKVPASKRAKHGHMGDTNQWF